MQNRNSSNYSWNTYEPQYTPIKSLQEPLIVQRVSDSFNEAVARMLHMRPKHDFHT